MILFFPFFLFLDYRTDSFFRYFFKPIQFANPESLFEYFRLLNSSSKISLNNPNNYNIVYSLLKVVLEFITMKVILTRLLNSIKHSPYSITLNKYYKKYSLNKKFKQIPISAQDNIAENCSAFVKHISSNQNESVYSEIEVYYLEKENCQYLSISNFNFEGKITKEMIICYQEISTNDAKILLEEYYD